MKTRKLKRPIETHFIPVVTKGPKGFAPVDLSLEGVNKWRASVCLPLLSKLP
jgi:hypothetical protein